MGVYISAEGVTDLLRDIDLKEPIVGLLDKYFSHNRLGVFIKALKFAAENNMGLIEAAEVIVPDPMDLNKGTVCYSNLLNCDPEGAFLYQDEAMKQLVEVMKDKKP